jgi:hypothetical protein
LAWRLVTPQVPLELLQRIFLALADIYFGQPIYSESWGRPSWIDITYVCRYWRSAALNLRELWSFITPNLPIGWLQAMIERSSPLPMSIIILVGDAYMPVEPYGFNLLTASELLSTLTSRIRTLSLVGHTTGVLHVLNHLHRPSPIESLTLSRLDLGGPVDLPESLFGGDAPHLRRLTFDTDAYIRVPLWLLANITHFTNNICIALYLLHKMLEAMPQLEELCITRIFIYPNSTDIDDDLRLFPLTKLPRLSLLSIRDQFPNSFLVLSSWIDGPPTLRRHFFLQDDYDMGSSWARSLRALQPFIPGDSTLGSSDGGLRVAQICGHDCKSLEMWSRTYSESASTVSREDALFLLCVEWPDRNPVNSRFPTLSLHFSHAAHIEDLTVTVSPETGIEGASSASESEADALIIVERWMELLTDMSFVKTLRLHCSSCASASVLRALSASEGSILPHLQLVIVINLSVHPGDAVSPDGTDEAGGGRSVAGRNFLQENVGPELVEAVNSRPGLEVVLAGCEVDEKMLGALQKRARVTWGSYCGFRESSSFSQALYSRRTIWRWT